MTEKVQKIRKEVERLKSNLIYGACASQVVMETYCKEEAYNEVLAILDTMQEEPISEDWLDMSKIDCKIQYANIESGIHAHAEDYSFNIESQLFNQLTKEQQELWRKEIEQAVISGGHCGVELARDKRYKENQEPVSEDLEEAADSYIKTYGEILGFGRQTFKAGANWQKEQFEKDCTDLCNGIATAKGIAVAMAYDNGMADVREQMMKNLWKPADGDDLPEIDREVVALLDNGKVVFAHRPPEYWDGKDIVTGKVTRNYPKTYDKGGWNIPNVRWWLDCLMPKEIEL